MSDYKDPILEFKLVTFNSQNYLYIEEENPNNKDEEQRVSWIYIELCGFWMKKQGRDLTLGNSNDVTFTLTGYTESMVNKWTKEIKSTINFP